MTLSFRKSKELIPGLKVNLSKTGVGFFVGSRKTDRFTISPNGKVVGSISLPGTVLRYTENLTPSNKRVNSKNTSELISTFKGLFTFLISLIKLIFVLGFLALIVWFCIIAVSS